MKMEQQQGRNWSKKRGTNSEGGEHGDWDIPPHPTIGKRRELP